MLHVFVTCCLLAAALGAPQYGSSYSGKNKNSIIQRSVLPRKFEVSRPARQYQGGSGGSQAGGGGYQSSSAGYQSSSAGYQSSSGGYQSSLGGYQSSSGRYQSAGGYQGSSGGGYGGQNKYGGGGEDYNSKPAYYDFAYEVSDPYNQLQFGHQESRRDSTARGSYRVLLPDGRTQIVEYVADEEGYKPTVTYQEAAGGYGGQGGYSQNNGGSQYSGGKGSYGQKSNGYSRNQGGYANQIQGGGYQQNGNRY